MLINKIWIIGMQKDMTLNSFWHVTDALVFSENDFKTKHLWNIRTSIDHWHYDLKKHSWNVYCYRLRSLYGIWIKECGWICLCTIWMKFRSKQIMSIVVRWLGMTHVKSFYFVFVISGFFHFWISNNKLVCKVRLKPLQRN